MRSALVNIDTNIVENVIIADPMYDPAPEGYVLAVLPDDSSVAVGWVFRNGVFVDPTAEVSNGQIP